MEVKYYRNITWSTDAELSRQLGKCKQYVYLHKKRGETYTKIIDDVLDSNKTYRNITWGTDVELSEKLNKKPQYVRSYIHKGYTHEQIIDYTLDGFPMTKMSYRGIEWSTDIELSEKLGKNRLYVGTRKNKYGESSTQIIDDILDRCKCYRGIVWTNSSDLAKKINKSRTYVTTHIRVGMTEEDLIDAYLDTDSVYMKVHRTQTGRYKNIVWTSVADLSRTLNKSETYIQSRLNKGMTFEEIIDDYLAKH